jgi:hypothetical protein
MFNTTINQQKEDITSCNPSYEDGEDYYDAFFDEEKELQREVSKIKGNVITVSEDIYSINRMSLDRNKLVEEFITLAKKKGIICTPFFENGTDDMPKFYLLLGGQLILENHRNGKYNNLGILTTVPNESWWKNEYFKKANDSNNKAFGKKGIRLDNELKWEKWGRYQKRFYYDMINKPVSEIESILDKLKKCNSQNGITPTNTKEYIGLECLL